MPHTHPNRRNFEGILSRLNLPSDAAPMGAKGHRILVPGYVAEEAIPSLLGMPIGFATCWEIHDDRQRCGIITEAKVDGDALRVCGYIFDRDFPEVAKVIREGKLGMSFDVADAHIVDMDAEIWTIERLTFCGAAILFAEKAAYRTTRISLSAQAASENPRLIKFELSNILVEGEGK